ncbi:MAG: hypothetical protein LBF49_00920 [Puniceicoccales bacterium]|nr:hypothetical protein [Puniceicoccales bacterium]
MSVCGSNVVRWYAYVDEGIGGLVHLEASTININEEAKSRVMRSLRHGPANAQLGERQFSCSRETQPQVPVRFLDLREIVKSHGPTVEGFEMIHKVCQQKINYDFLKRIPDLNQLSESSLNRLKKRVTEERMFYYEKKYRKDSEWQVCKEANAFVDYLLGEKNKKVEQEIVAIAKEGGFVRARPKAVGEPPAGSFSAFLKSLILCGLTYMVLICVM